VVIVEEIPENRMLNPLNIAPATGQTIGPIIDPLTSREPNTHAAAHEGETFESVLAGDSEATDAPEDAALLIETTDTDPMADTDGADTDEVEYSNDQDQATALPDAGDADEIIELFEGRNVPSHPADEGGFIAGRDDISPDESIEFGEERQGEEVRNITQAPRDRAANELAFLNAGNDNRLLRANQPRAPQPVKAETPAIPGFRSAADQPVLTREIISQAPVVSTGLQATTDEIALSTGARPVQPLLGVALSQQANLAIAVQNEAQNNAADKQPLQLDPEQALPEKPVGENSQPISRQPVATAQSTLPPLSLAEGVKAYKDAGNIPERSKENSRGNGLIISDRGLQNPPVLPVGTTTNTPVAPPAPILSGLSEIQLESGRVNWISETGVLADTGTISDLSATGRTSMDSLFRNPDLPRHIAAQIAQVVERGGAEKPVELLLNPTELGRVKISMVSIDGVMNVSVVADRPETLDLMRRHIDVLAQEFLDIGYGQADFAFGQNSPENGGNSDQHAPDGSPHRAGLPEEITPAPEAITATRIITDRVDIRL
jgi:hypothetical protein